MQRYAKNIGTRRVSPELNMQAYVLLRVAFCVGNFTYTQHLSFLRLYQFD